MSGLTAADKLWKKIFADRGVRLTKEWVKAEIERCKNDTVYFINQYALIRCKLDDESVLPPGAKIYDDVIDIKLYPIQEEYIRDIETNQNVVALKTRQSGISMSTGFYLLKRSTFEKNKEFIVISKAQPESIKFLDDLKFTQMHLPFFLRRRSSGNMKRLNLGTSHNWSVIRALPGGPTAGRGYTATVLVMDEAAFIPDADNIWAGASPILTTTGGKAVIISTPWEDEGLFYDLVKEAEDPKSDFKLIRIPWQSIPNRDMAWYDRECAKLLHLRAKIQTELDMEFISMGSPFFDVEKLKLKPTANPLATINNTNVELTDLHCDTSAIAAMYEMVSMPAAGQGYIYEFPRPGAVYMLSHDPAEDATSSAQGIVVSRVDNFPKDPPKVVLEWRCKSPVMDTLIDLSQYYNNCKVLVEKNRGYAVIMHFAAADKSDLIITRPNGQAGIITNTDSRQILLKLLNKFFTTDIDEVPLLSLEEAKQFRRTKSGKLKGKKYDDILFALGIGLLGLATMPDSIVPGAVTADQRLALMSVLKNAVDDPQISSSGAARYIAQLQKQLFQGRPVTNQQSSKTSQTTYSHLLPR